MKRALDYRSRISPNPLNLRAARPHAHQPGEFLERQTADRGYLGMFNGKCGTGGGGGVGNSVG